MCSAAYVDNLIGSWCMKQIDYDLDAEFEYIAIVKNLEEFRESFFSILDGVKSKKLRQKLYQLIEQIEFGEVIIDSNDIVQWKAGDFQKQN